MLKYQDGNPETIIEILFIIHNQVQLVFALLCIRLTSLEWITGAKSIVNTFRLIVHRTGASATDDEISLLTAFFIQMSSNIASTYLYISFMSLVQTTTKFEKN
jgi:hypothetical protein